MRSSSNVIRVLLLADSHLGFDLPLNPRVERRRRGYDFLANHEKALTAAVSGAVDLVVHGGDLFHRPRVPRSLAFQAFRSFLKLADVGVPVFVVPGNHEKSRIPHKDLASHPNLHIFQRPETRVIEVRGQRVALTGFPYERRNIRERFTLLLSESGWCHQPADARLLCMHHCVEGATVGPSDFTFRYAPDVIRCADLPGDFAAVVSGHIHRHQVLWTDLEGSPLSAPVLYPGSVERTAFAEIGEEKGFMLLEIGTGETGGRLEGHEFVPLPTRPMLVRELVPDAASGPTWRGSALSARLREVVGGAPKNAVLRVRITGEVPMDVRGELRAGPLRALAPHEMNLEVIVAEDRGNRGPIRQRGRPGPNHQPSPQLSASEL